MGLDRTRKSLIYGGQGQNRTADASLFRVVVYRCHLLLLPDLPQKIRLQPPIL